MDAMFVIDDFGDYPGRQKVREAIEAGLVVKAFNYFGMPGLRKDGDVIRGTLHPYFGLAAPEDPTFDDVEAALDWFEESYHATHR